MTSKSTARRPRGEGTIYYNTSRDRWIGAVTIDGRRRKVNARTKTDARARLARLLAAKTTGTPVANRSITVAGAVATFLDRELPERHGRGGGALAPNTEDGYRVACDTIVAELGTTRLASLTVEDVEGMLDRLASRRDKPMAAATLRKVRGTLQRVLAAAVRRRHIAYNVALEARIPRRAVKKAAESPGRTALKPTDARKLLDAFKGERNGAVFALSLRVGLRPGEAAGLHWEDLDDNVIHVRRGVRIIRGRPTVVDELKTATSQRAIELPGDLIDWLDAHRRAQVAERLAMSQWHDERLMFPSTNGRVLSPSNVRRHLATICEAAGVPVVKPNELRHSCASLLSDLGVSNELIADLLGHTTTKMVEATYRHRLRPVVDVAARADWASAQS